MVLKICQINPEISTNFQGTSENWLRWEKYAQIFYFLTNFDLFFAVAEVLEEKQPQKKKPAPVMVDLTLSDSEDESPPKKLATSRIVMPGNLRASSSRVTDVENAVVMSVFSTLFDYNPSTNNLAYQLKRTTANERSSGTWSLSKKPLERTGNRGNRLAASWAQFPDRYVTVRKREGAANVSPGFLTRFRARLNRSGDENVAPTEPKN